MGNHAVHRRTALRGYQWRVNPPFPGDACRYLASTMTAPSLKYAALATLNLWLMTDSLVHKDLNNGTKIEKLDAIARGASRFGFWHELDPKYDEGVGLPSFQSALDVIDGLTPNEFTEDATKSINKISIQLSLRYGNRNVVSATSKLLWMKFRSPIVIYDKDAALALGTRLLWEYYDQWHARFAVYEQGVIAACHSLQDVIEYVYDPVVATSKYIADLSGSGWFRSRVFGTYLTNIGRAAR